MSVYPRMKGCKRMAPIGSEDLLDDGGVAPLNFFVGRLE